MGMIPIPTNSPLLAPGGQPTQPWAAFFRKIGVTYGLTPIVKSGTYAMASGDTLMLVSASAPWSLSLPAPGEVIGLPFYVKKTDNNTNAVTILPHGSETIDGATSLALGTAYAHVALVSDGANWWRIA